MPSSKNKQEKDSRFTSDQDWIKLRPTLLERLLQNPHHRDEVDYFMNKAERLQTLELPAQIIEQLRNQESSFFGHEIPEGVFYSDKEKYFARYPFLGADTELLNVDTLTELHKRQLLSDYNWEGKPLKDRVLDFTINLDDLSAGEFVSGKSNIFEELPSHSLQLITSLVANVRKQDSQEPKLEGLIKIQDIYNPLYQVIFKGEEVWRRPSDSSISDFFLQYYISSRDSLEFHFQYFPNVNRFGFNHLERDLIDYLVKKQYKETPTFDWLWSELVGRTPSSAPSVKDGIPVVRDDSKAIEEAFFSGTENTQTGPYLKYILSKVENIESVFVPQRYIDALSAHHNTSPSELLRSVPDRDFPTTYLSELNLSKILDLLSSEYASSPQAIRRDIKIDEGSTVSEFYDEDYSSGAESQHYAIFDSSFTRHKNSSSILESVIIVKNMDPQKSHNKMVFKLHYEAGNVFAEYYLNGKTLEYHILAFEDVSEERIRKIPSQIRDILKKTQYDTAPLYQQIREMLSR